MEEFDMNWDAYWEKQAQERNRIHYKSIWLGLLVVVIAILSGYILFYADNSYSTNLFTESLSVIATVAFLDRLNDWREDKRLQKRLLREVGSQSNDIAINAVDCLREEGWLGLLKGSNKTWLNLAKVRLYSASLQGVRWRVANLEGADLRFSNFQKGDFLNSSFKGVLLSRAQLQNTDLRGVDFTNASLVGANLTGANLVGANMTNVNWLMISKDRTRTTVAIMPDGQEWTTDTDVQRFTNPKHKNFWKPSDATADWTHMPGRLPASNYRQ